MVVSPKDGKSNTVAITSITNRSGKRYKVPEDLMYMNVHEELKKTTTYTKVKANLKRRHDNMSVWFILNEELQGKYFDEAGNLEIAGRFLNEMENIEQIGPATKPFQIMSMDTIGGFGGQRSTKKISTLVSGSLYKASCVGRRGGLWFGKWYVLSWYRFVHMKLVTRAFL
ncbi:unnamed protein product [Trichogramma brassicae]|uniref:Uncharacterized protein n=1 Tax=Trichogramma brassicae TaxID=86971 RepID=A0A6H5I6P9_9HYME|nr:unnamed protein product [Trichogramma brassicae]